MSGKPIVRVGQIWASTHKGDIKAGVRQRRRVTAIQHGPDNSYAFLHTEGGRNPGAYGVRMSKNGIPGHRLVEDVA